jgi:hypothetical protein
MYCCVSRFAVLLLHIFHMQPGNQEYVDSFCRHVRGNPTYADGYGRWFLNPLHARSKALDLVYKLHWQRAEGASMWDYYLLQHYVPGYRMPLLDLASSVWEARQWLMSTNLTGLNYVPVYRTHTNMETEFRRVVRKFARWRRGFFQRTYPHTGKEWLEPYPTRVHNLPDDMLYKEKEHQLQEWCMEAVTVANHGCVHIRSINLMAITKTSMHFAKTYGSFLCPERITMSLYRDIGACSRFH